MSPPRRNRSLAGFVLAQLRARRGRAVALGAGILIAAVCFGLLSSETASSELQVTATVKQNFRSAYDILVRPRDAETAFEREHHVVDDGFQSGLFGGITMQQYAAIKSMPGVSVAAPVANVGYVLITEAFFVPFPKTVTRTSQEVLRVNTTWNVHHGLEHVPGDPFYLYYTNGRLSFPTSNYQDGTRNVPGLPRPIDVCMGYYDGSVASTVRPVTVDGRKIEEDDLGAANKHPYQASLAGNYGCSARHTTESGIVRATLHDSHNYQGLVRYGAEVIFAIPVLIAGVDPDAESQLVGLKGAMTSGRYFGEQAGLSLPLASTRLGARVRYYPVLASDRTYFDEAADLTIKRLHLPAGARLDELVSRPSAYRVLPRTPGTVLGHATVSPSTGWRDSLQTFNTTFGSLSTILWRTSPTHDAITRDGVIVPRVVRDDPQVWVTGVTGSVFPGHSFAPPGGNDTWYRSITGYDEDGNEHEVNGRETFVTPKPTLIGTFDPGRLRGFSPLSKVPLQTFYPPTVTAADAAARRELGSGALGPTMDLAGYLSQPPLLLTTIKGAIAIENGDGESFEQSESMGPGRPRETFHVEAYEGLSPKAPISTIQVRVKGVSGPNQLSLDRIKLVAEDIARTTGLTVDITAGSSPTPETIRLAAGKFGEPALLVHQGWVKEDVDSGIISALSSEDLALSLLVLVVCGLFVASATAASVRQRRREIAILSTLGWNARSIFALVLGEAALVGLIAGLIGCAVSVALAAAGSLRIPGLRLVLITPVAIALAVLAAAWPAWRAANVPPMDALRDPVLTGARGPRVRSAAGMALANLLRVPGRTLVALITLMIGVGALALIVGVTLAFRGGVAGTLLGSVVSVSVRGVDVVSSVLVVIVGAAAVTDVMVVSLRERAAEMATLRAVGWTERQIVALAAREGLVLGVTGSLLGAGVGIAAVALLGASTGSVLLAAGIAVLGGVLVTTAALVLPLSRLRRATLVDALAGE
jgi:putative ABC transport system permease protein